MESEAMETSPEDGTGTGPVAEPPPVSPTLRFNLRELILIAALIALMLAALTPWYQRRRELARVAQVRADLRFVTIAIEAYYIDNMAQPACGIAEGPARIVSRCGGALTRAVPSGVLTANSSTPLGSGARRMITFRLRHVTTSQSRGRTTRVPSTMIHTLTTPVAYLHSHPTDPFADSPGATFGYFHDPGGWIVWSPGPDRDENAPEGPGDLGALVEFTYDSSIAQPSPRLLTFQWDPTNGHQSSGDLFRVRQ
ncbi:hypothetical protein JXA47_16635 [Candidatus Sumerlaeota bacterium]|nr:hypothetical protein [Candidatus Sumerlaeota bacterium]